MHFLVSKESGYGIRRGKSGLFAQDAAAGLGAGRQGDHVPAGPGQRFAKFLLQGGLTRPRHATDDRDPVS